MFHCCGGSVHVLYVHVSNMEPAPQQLQVHLRLVPEELRSPVPGISGQRLLWKNQQGVAAVHAEVVFFVAVKLPFPRPRYDGNRIGAANGKL